MRATPLILLAFFITAGLLFSATGLCSDLPKFYKEREFGRIITLLEGLPDTAQNEESYTYLALSYTQKRDYEKAKGVLLKLLALDPDYHVYRIKYDLDFSIVLEKTDLRKKLDSFQSGTVLARHFIQGHEVVQTSHGTYFYWNGVRIFLTNELSVAQAGFVDSDTIYYLGHSLKKKNRKASQTLYFYSGKERRLLKEIPLEGSLEAIRIEGDSQILVQTTKGYWVVDTGSWDRTRLKNEK